MDSDGRIYYNEVAFSKNYHYLKMIAMEEKFHQKDLLAGNYDGVVWSDPIEKMINQGKGEHKAKMYIYKNQGLFYRYKHETLIELINNYGLDAGHYYQGNINSPMFNKMPWHTIYRIPRYW